MIIQFGLRACRAPDASPGVPVGNGNCPADPAARAGDHSNLVFQRLVIHIE
jgi:hypothetical protein